MKSLLILNGPNLNLLGVREPALYGHQTLDDIRQQCLATGAELGFEVAFRQSNHEGQLVEWLHEARTQASGIVFNPAGYSFKSVSLHDAVKAAGVPLVEVHITNIHRREEMYHHSLISKCAVGVICGLGSYGYEAALRFMARHLDAIRTPVDRSGSV